MIRNPLYISKDLEMGDYGFIGQDAWICANVSMGNYVMIARDCAILGGDHRYDVAGTPAIFSGRPSVPETVIGHDVWIGFRVSIVAGVKIGDGAVVAVGSVVTQDLPAYWICAGVPCKPIKKRFTEMEQAEHESMLTKPAFEGTYAHAKTAKR